MNWDDHDRKHEVEHDALDRLLQGASWPEPEPERLARLHQRWRRLSSDAARRTRLIRIAWGLTIAAGLLIAVVVWRLLPQAFEEPRRVAPAVPQKHQRAQPLQHTAERPVAPEAPSEKREPDGPAEISPRHVAAEVPATPRSRPATVYEQLVFRALVRRRQPSVRQPDGQIVEEAIARRLADPAADLDKLAEPLLSSRESYEPLLVERIRRCRGPEQGAAIELLGRVGTARSLPLLMELSRQPEAHAAAVRAVARLADSETLGGLAAEEPNADLQQELLAALVTRQDAQSVAVYLALVPQPQTRDAALAVLDRVDRVPVELLFEFLASPKREQRTAAAVVLGSLDDPEVSERLIRMVVREGNRQEPLLALVASTEPDASSFVNLARRDPLLVGSVRTIEYRLKTFFP